MHRPICASLLCLIPLLLLGGAAQALALDRITLNSPRTLTLPGQDLSFSISVPDITGRRQANVFFRRIGETAFSRLAMTEKPEDEFTAELPGQNVAPPGIEFYIEVRNDRNETFTLPVKNPLGLPRKLEFSTGQSVSEALVFPDLNGQRITSRRPAITAPLPPETLTPGPETVRMALDDVDVTALAVITATSVSYTPDADLEFGSHHVIVEVLGPDGNPMPQEHWYFSIPQTATFDRASASFQLDTDLGARLFDSNTNSSSPDWTAQTSGTLSAVLEQGKFKASLDANGWYIDDSEGAPGQDKFSLNNYLLKLAYGEQSLSLGDVSVEMPELAGGPLERRGGLLELTTGETTLQTFMLRSNTVTDLDHSLSVDNPDQRLSGVTLTHNLYPARDVVLKATAVKGSSGGASDYDNGDLLPPDRGELYSLLVSGSIVDELLLGEVEYARSAYDTDSTDSIARKYGQAWRTRLTGRKDTLDYGAGFTSLDRYFQSIVMPTGINNRREYTLYAAKTFEESSLTFNALHSFDNAEMLDDIPTVRSTGIDLGYTLNRPSWPFLFANANLNWQESGHEPSGFDAVDNQSRILAVGLSLARDTWSVVPSYVLTSFDDASQADADSVSHQFVLSLGWQPIPVLSFNPAVTYARTESDPDSLVIEDWLGTLSATWIVTDAQNLNLTVSGLDSRTDDGSMHTTVFNAQAQYNWVLGPAFLDTVTKTVSLRGMYSNTLDRVSDDSDEEYTAFLSLNLSIPVSWP